jgi:hypothetical protein
LLYLPPEELARRRREFAHDITMRCEPDNPVANAASELVQQYDRRLCVVKAREHIAPGTPLIPGYYHLLCVNEQAPMSVFAIHANGAFCEPDSRILEILAAGDLHDPRTLRRFNEAQRRELRDNERDADRADDERKEHLRDLVNAATRTQVSTDRTRPWSQNVAGRRGHGSR